MILDQEGDNGPGLGEERPRVGHSLRCWAPEMPCAQLDRAVELIRFNYLIHE